MDIVSTEITSIQTTFSSDVSYSVETWDRNCGNKVQIPQKVKGVTT